MLFFTAGESKKQKYATSFERHSITCYEWAKEDDESQNCYNCQKVILTEAFLKLGSLIHG